MKTEITPGFNYYELPFAEAKQLPEGAGITLIDGDKKVIGFYANYFAEDGGPAPMDDIEIVEGGEQVVVENLTQNAKRDARLIALGAIYGVHPQA